LRGVLSPEELEYVPRSFDIIGSRGGAVAVVEFPEGTPPRVKEAVARAIREVHANVRAVLEKRGGRAGPYRLRGYELIAGEPCTEVVHREHGVSLKLDPTKVYFSPREATERLRVAQQVRPGETVMVMFAGVGPYAIMIAKRQPQVEKVVAIEINPDAYLYMVENVRINKLEGKVEPVLGDVRLEARRWYGACDRVVMPLPRGAYQFLDEAFQCLKPGGGFIHFYHWAAEDNLFVEAYSLLERAAILHSRSIRLIDARRVSPYAPRVYKVCLDVQVCALGHTL